MMDFLKAKPLGFNKFNTKPIIILAISILVAGEIYLLIGFQLFHWSKSSYKLTDLHESELQCGVRKDKFLQVPPIIFGGLNNQKIGLARSLLTARFLSRTLLIPVLSPTIIYKEVQLQQPIEFDEIFDFDKFNSLCNGFVQLGKYSELLNKTKPFELRKGRNRKWSKERDLNQLKQCKNDSKIHDFEVIRVDAKQAFLWHDHWSVKDYAKIFECLVLINEIENDVTKVISKIREVGIRARVDSNSDSNSSFDSDSDSNSVSSNHVPYIAVHMRIEKDWMDYCNSSKLKTNMTHMHACVSKQEIMERVSRITDINRRVVVYLAVADHLLGDNSILSGWKPGLFPYEKKRLGVWDIYKKYPYIIQSAIDFEVCLRADVFVGNSFSTFSGLVVLSRTYRLFKLGLTSLCDSTSNRLMSYAHNILGDSGGAPKRWMIDISDSSLPKINYGTNNISCKGGK